MHTCIYIQYISCMHTCMYTCNCVRADIYTSEATRACTHTHTCVRVYIYIHIHTSEATISILDRMTKPEFRPSIAGNLVCVFVCICLFVEHFFCLMFSCLFVTDPLRKTEIFEKYKRIMKYSRSYFPRTYKYKYLHSLRRARGSHYFPDGSSERHFRHARFGNPEKLKKKKM